MMMHSNMNKDAVIVGSNLSVGKVWLECVQRKYCIVVLLCVKTCCENLGEISIAKMCYICSGVQKSHGRLLPSMEDKCENMLLARDSCK